MKLEFFKYEGTGNDFILFDDRENVIQLDNRQIRKLCDRRFGIGADGLILLRNKEAYDFEMVYFNSDGEPSSMCGNGGRCITSFARKLGIAGSTTKFLAADGMHESEFVKTDPDIVRLKMKDVENFQHLDEGWYVDTGSPHLVINVEGLQEMDVKTNGRLLRYSDRFREKGVNVNFVEHLADRISVRTYERGVEDETLSCGTGVTASALVSRANSRPGDTSGFTIISTQGGELKVHADKHANGFKNIWLEGPANYVFKGEIEV